MTKKWVIGVIGAFAVLAMAGVGFSAFTASATVYGNVAAATVSIQISSVEIAGCYYLPNTPLGEQSAPGNLAFSPISASATSVTYNVSNLLPGVYCFGYVTLVSESSVPVNVSVALNTPGVSGVCSEAQSNCFDVVTASGLESSGIWGFYSNTGYASSVTNFVTLSPGATYTDVVSVAINTGSTYAAATGSYSIVYTASAGY